MTPATAGRHRRRRRQLSIGTPHVSALARQRGRPGHTRARLTVPRDATAGVRERQRGPAARCRPQPQRTGRHIQGRAGSAEPERLIAADRYRSEQATGTLDQRIPAVHARERGNAQRQRQDQGGQVGLRTLRQPSRHGKAADDPGIRSTASQPPGPLGHTRHHPPAARPAETGAAATQGRAGPAPPYAARSGRSRYRELCIVMHARSPVFMLKSRISDPALVAQESVLDGLRRRRPMLAIARSMSVPNGLSCTR